MTTAPRAADLPVGSVVATGSWAFIKVGFTEGDVSNARVRQYVWQESGAGGYVSNAQVNEYLSDGRATVLRVGDGREEA